MAIYRLEKKSISRGNGHNLAAAIGYRSGLKITDHNPKNTERKTHDYSKKSDVAHSEIILTDKLTQAGVQLDFEQIANLVEIGETTKRGKMKKNAKLASEYVLAGSHELSLDENIKAFREFAEQQSREQGVIGMVFVHDPKLGNDARASKDAGDNTKTHDERNIHAHIVLLSRQVDINNATGQLELGNKSDSELSDTARAEKGLPSSRDWLKGVREQWANIQNKSLERHNIAPITHKSYKDLGLAIKPGLHLGKNAKALESKGLKTNLGERNDAIKRANRAVIKSATDSIFDREDRAPEFDYFETKRTDRFIKAADRAIATRATAPTPSPSTARTREQLAAKRVRTERFYKYQIEQAVSCHARNTRIIAARLAWRHRHGRFDERQLQELDNFFQTLNIKDLEKENSSHREAIVESKLTDEIIIDNPHIIKILRNPVDERNEYADKSLKFNDKESFVTKPSLEPETSQNEDLPHLRPRNSFRP